MQKLEKDPVENCHGVSGPCCNEVPNQRFLKFAALLISMLANACCPHKKRSGRWP